MTANQIIRVIDDRINARGLTYKDVCKRANVTYDVYRAYKLGDHMSTLKRVMRLADVVGLELILRNKEDGKK